jgi:hypothetical protein
MPKNDAILTKMLMIPSPVPQASKPAVPQASKPAGHSQPRRLQAYPGPADLEIGGTADLEICATARELDIFGESRHPQPLS